MKKRIAMGLKTAVTAGLLWMIFREHGLLAALGPHLHAMAANWGWVLAGLFCLGISTWLGAVRWHVLLRGGQQPVLAADALWVTVASHFFNITSFGTAGGDAYRVLALARRSGMRRLPVLASVILDHMAGMAGMGVLFLSFRAGFASRLEGGGPEVAAMVKGYTLFSALSLCGVVLAFVSFIPVFYRHGEKRLPRLLGWPPLKSLAQASAALLREPGQLCYALVLSVLVFLTQFLSFYCAIFAVGGTAPLLNLMAAMPMVDFAAGLPISVSGLGVREKAFETLMHAFAGMPAATAVSASLAGWSMSIIWGLFGGILFIRGGSERNAAGTEPHPNVAQEAK